MMSLFVFSNVISFENMIAFRESDETRKTLANLEGGRGVFVLLFHPHPSPPLSTNFNHAPFPMDIVVIVCNKNN